MSPSKTTTVAAKLQRVREAIERVQRRIDRNHNALVKLQRQEKRLAKQLEPKPAVETDHMNEAEFQRFARRRKPVELTKPPTPNGNKPDDLDIRNQGWLSPRGEITEAAKAELQALNRELSDKLLGKSKDDAARAEIVAGQQANAKIKAQKAAVRAKLKKQLSNTTKSELRKMPLEGKAALEKIKNG